MQLRLIRRKIRIDNVISFDRNEAVSVMQCATESVMFNDSMPGLYYNVNVIGFNVDVKGLKDCSTKMCIEFGTVTTHCMVYNVCDAIFTEMLMTK